MQALVMGRQHFCLHCFDFQLRSVARTKLYLFMQGVCRSSVSLATVNLQPGALPGAGTLKCELKLCAEPCKNQTKHFVACRHAEELTGLVLTSFSLLKPLSFSGPMELPDCSIPSLTVNKTVFSTPCLNSSVSNFKYVFQCHFCVSVFSVA